MFFDIANTALSVLVVGSLISISFLLPERDGYLLDSSDRTKTFLKVTSGLWVIAAIGNLLSTLANIFESNLSEVLQATIIRSFITQVTLGKLLAYQVVVALLVFLLSSRIKRNGGGFWLMVIAFTGLLAPVFQSHSSSLGSHSLAIGSLLIHVLALTCWIGSVVALRLMATEDQALAFPRVSSIALWSSTAVVLSGVVNA